MKLIRLCFDPEIIFEDEQIQGRELFEPCVIICNHEKVGDGPILRYIFKNEKVCSLMAKDIMENPLMKTAISGCGCIPVDRDAAATSWLHDCVQELKEGNSVIIFPEGTTLKSNAIEKFKSGFVLLAETANVRVLPTAISRNCKRPKVKVGIPTELTCKSLTRNTIRSETERFQQIVTDMYNSITDHKNIITSTVD